MNKLQARLHSVSLDNTMRSRLIQEFLDSIYAITTDMGTEADFADAPQAGLATYLPHSFIPENEVPDMVGQLGQTALLAAPAIIGEVLPEEPRDEDINELPRV